MGLRLPVGDVTVLLGPAAVRRQVMAALDDDSGRCASGHSAVRVQRLAAAADDDVHRRIEAIESVREAGATIVLVDRLTEGLAAPARREPASGGRQEGPSRGAAGSFGYEAR